MILNSDAIITELLSGNVVGIPTDTVYGFAVLKPYAFKVYELKQRDLDKKLISFVKEDFNFVVDRDIQNIFDRYWPGNYTFIFEEDNEFVSYRIPNEPNVLKLLSKLDDVILTTSANLSGEKPVYSSEEFEVRFPDIPLLEEEILIDKSKEPSQIYILKNKEMIKIR